MENCVGEEETDAPADFQSPARQTSPYLTTPVSILIGPEEAHYTVPRTFLSESPQWSSLNDDESRFWGYQKSRNHIALREVNEDVGHTLVHYLYTGTFQKLQSLEEDDDVTAELKKNVHLYSVAANYGLAGLKGLVLEKIHDNEGLVGIFDILDTIKEASMTLLKDILELKPYFKRELKAAFESDDTLFRKERFIGLFGEAKQFDRTLMGVVADIYSEKITQISQNTPAVINGPPAEAIFATGTTSPGPPLLEAPATEKSEEPVGYEKLYEYEKLSECEDPVTSKDLVNRLDLSGEYLVPCSALEKEPYKDLAVNEVNVSEKKIKKFTYSVIEQFPTFEKEKSEKGEEPIPESDPWYKPLHPDQDLSGWSLPVNTQSPIGENFQSELPDAIDELEKFEILDFRAPPFPSFGDLPPYNEPDSPFGVGRGLGNLTSCEVVSGEAVSRAEVATLEKFVLCQEDTSAEPVFIGEAAPPAKAVLIKEAAPSAEAVPPTEEAPVDLDLPSGKFKNKKGKKGRKVKMIPDPETEAAPFIIEFAPCTEVAPNAEPATCAEVAPNAEPATCAEAAPSVEPTSCAEPALCVDPAPCIERAPFVLEAPNTEPVPCTEVVPGIEAALQEDILPKKKINGRVKEKKKGRVLKKAERWIINATKSPIPPDPVLVPEPSTSSEILDGEIASAPIIIAEEQPRTTESEVVDLVRQHHPDSDDESRIICASRATHLLVDDEWKKCIKCRALIHGLSLELARNYMNENKNGYEII